MAEDTKITAKIHVKNRTKPFQITVEEEENNSVNNERRKSHIKREQTRKIWMHIMEGRKIRFLKLK